MMHFATLIAFYLALFISLYELLGILSAVMKGKTKARARLFLRLSILILVGLIFIQYNILRSQLDELKPQEDGSRIVQILPPDMDFLKVPFLISVVTSAIMLSFLMIEINNLISARKRGLTRNLSRLVSSVVITLCLGPIMYGTVDVWNKYSKALEEFSQVLPKAAVKIPEQPPQNK